MTQASYPILDVLFLRASGDGGPKSGCLALKNGKYLFASAGAAPVKKGDLVEWALY